MKQDHLRDIIEYLKYLDIVSNRVYDSQKVTLRTYKANLNTVTGKINKLLTILEMPASPPTPMEFGSLDHEYEEHYEIRCYSSDSGESRDLRNELRDTLIQKQGFPSYEYNETTEEQGSFIGYLALTDITPRPPVTAVEKMKLLYASLMISVRSYDNS